MTNSLDLIIIAWNNLRDVFLQRRVLQQGETITGSAIFFLNAVVDQYREVSECVLHVCDYSGKQSKHKLPMRHSWYEGLEKGITLVDATVHEVGGVFKWEGITIDK